jgi:hypothetical protein
MSDNLAKRLRETTHMYQVDCELKMKCADRIEELEAKLLESEAFLAKAVKTLEFYGNERNYEGEYYADPCGCCGSWYEPKIHKDGQDSGDYARHTLAELTGGKDE